ncbi:hypothetical protein C8Q70DRAFT_337978 [Cubamyces menziesii]|nr:hypothetical protein C8Q70DRAFT_337978 [Cubamyces menziesii]
MACFRVHPSTNCACVLRARMVPSSAFYCYFGAPAYLRSYGSPQFRAPERAFDWCCPYSSHIHIYRSMLRARALPACRAHV